MAKTRTHSTSIETPIRETNKRPRLESGEQSRVETSDAKGEGRWGDGGEKGDEGVIDISSAEDVLLSEDRQIQEVLFMSMQPNKEEQGIQPNGSGKSKLDPNDRKGKQPTISTYSKPGSGQSSKVPRTKALCKICMERVPATQTFAIEPCNHIFCNSCIVNYITSKLDGNIATFPCPNPGCESGSLNPLTCQHIVPAATFDKWGRMLCESSLGQSKFYCPFKDCSALLVDDGEKVENCECPHCHRMFCARCKVPWHGDVSCKDFQRLGKDERGQEDLMLRKLARDKRWQRCPQCRMYVEKIDGCMFMKCRCGYCFCYVCATPMSKETHYCTKCKR